MCSQLGIRMASPNIGVPNILSTTGVCSELKILGTGSPTS